MTAALHRGHTGRADKPTLPNKHEDNRNHNNDHNQDYDKHIIDFNRQWPQSL